MRIHKLAQGFIGSYAPHHINGGAPKTGISKQTIGPSSFRKKLLMYAAFKGERGFTLSEYHEFRVTPVGIRSRETVAASIKFLRAQGWLELRPDGRNYITEPGREILSLVGRRDAAALRDEIN